MNYLDAMLSARAHQARRALRSAACRHRRLVEKPLALVLWQLGAEPFSAAALAWGMQAGSFSLAVAGEPRNRDLAFAALLPFARWFNPWFRSHPGQAPQVLVANPASVEMLGRLGRRLAYLPTDGPHPAEPALVELGRHLLFLWRHAATPGQQLVVALTDLLGSHWATPQSPLERQSLAALDAYLDPPAGLDGFAAAVLAEQEAAGPVPGGEDEERLGPLVEQFNRHRGGSTDPAVVQPLLAPIEAHYRRLTGRTWDLIWRCRGREWRYREAPSVGRRWDEDCRAYAAHLEWLSRGGLRRTRQTPRQAAMTLRNLEEASRRLEAEEACDDPARMIPYLLENKAVRGRVVSVDRQHEEPGERRRVKRPLVTLHSTHPCLMPAGKELWWTEQPDAREFLVCSVQDAAGGGSLVTLMLMTSSAKSQLPAVGAEACFSIHTTAGRWLALLPEAAPWTHQPAVAPSGMAPIEDEDSAR